MALVQIYKCDHCSKHIVDPNKGLLIKGSIWKADPSIAQSIKTNEGNPLIQTTDEPTVYCFSCLENKIRSMDIACNNSHMAKKN